MAGSQTNKNLKTLADKKAEQFKWVGLAEFAFRLFLDDLSSLIFLAFIRKTAMRLLRDTM